jgi:hypothetical protein
MCGNEPIIRRVHDRDQLPRDRLGNDAGYPFAQNLDLRSVKAEKHS